MAFKVTYLFGAGASANALPLIKSNSTNGKLGLPEELKKFAAHYKSSSFSSPFPDIVNDLASIADKCIEFGSPDLYAKHLWETGDLRKYALLKKFMANFICHEETLPHTKSGQGRFDQRALSFLTTIAQNEKIPPNVRVLSWNYDGQLEIASKKLKPINSQVYKMIKGFTCWPNYQDAYDYDQRHQYNFGNIFLLHLNGVAGYNYSKRTFSEKTNAIFNFDNANDSMLSFAWEDDSNDHKRTFLTHRIDYMRKIAEGTEILVVVGYSFPFFNRKMDDMIINSMRSTLTKIYFQDPFLDGIQIMSQFGIISGGKVKIESISSRDNYCTPYELYSS
jgi:hypothetical protein